MDEPAFFNHSPHVAQLLPILDRDGAEARIAIIKATFGLRPGGGLMAAEQPRDIRLGDEPWGSPAVADLRLPGDFCLAKPGTDVVLSGYAVPPDGVITSHMDVHLRVADRQKVLRVHGERVWRRGMGGIVVGPSAPLVPTPLSWSRAWGGSDFTDPAHPVEECRNPVGRGISRQPDRLVGLPAPQIESPDDPVTAAGRRHVPVGCAPLGRHFEPRRSAAGTHDATWLQSVYPGRPSDYREVHEQCASPDLIFTQPLRGGEPIGIVGVHHEGPIHFVLPKWMIRVEADIDGATEERRPHLDTVVIDSSAMVVELVWRALFRCPARMRGRFTRVKVQAKEFLS